MKLPSHKTKIVCTIGPGSRSTAMLEELMKSGMNVARLNLSHGNPEGVREDVKNINEVAARLGHSLTIFMDLPGTKIRVGVLPEPRQLKKGEKVVLTVRETPADPAHIPVEYKQLPESVFPGGLIYLNDGFIQLTVDEVNGPDVACTVIVDGTLLSHKGLNLPGAKIFVDPITPRDLELIEFGLSIGVDTFGISFVEKADDVIKVKEFARKLGKSMYAIAKIERADAIRNFDEILEVADAIMVARGDLGVETPIEDVPAIQKKLIAKSNLKGRPVITATQMLESMKANTRPTRAEVSDVANAILDGTDAVMLSEETAIGKYPVETVKMMAAIAASTERQRVEMNGGTCGLREFFGDTACGPTHAVSVSDVISRNVVEAADALRIRYITTPTDSGSTSRRVARFKPECWTLAFTSDERTARFLSLSYGVYPFRVERKSPATPWHDVILKQLKSSRLAKKDDKIIITEGRYVAQPGGTDSFGIIAIGEETK